MNIEDLQFPVYRLRHFTRKYSEGGILYLDTHRSVYVLDNTNIKGDTLGCRRLKIRKTEKLYPLFVLVPTIVELIKLKNGIRWFVDSSGVVFKYVKSRYLKVSYKKIIRTRHIEKLNKSLIYVRGVGTPIETTYNTRLDNKYVGLLRVKGSYLIYEFSDKKADKLTVRI